MWIFKVLNILKSNWSKYKKEIEKLCVASENYMLFEKGKWVCFVLFSNFSKLSEKINQNMCYPAQILPILMDEFRGNWEPCWIYVHYVLLPPSHPLQLFQAQFNKQVVFRVILPCERPRMVASECKVCGRRMPWLKYSSYTCTCIRKTFSALTECYVWI